MLEVMPEIVILILVLLAINLNHAELFCAAFQLQPVVLPLNISPAWGVKPLLEATIISLIPKQ